MIRGFAGDAGIAEDERALTVLIALLQGLSGTLLLQNNLGGVSFCYETFAD